MGFDLSGANPTTKKGGYFRNNVWWWRPLWGYVCDVCDFLTEEEMDQGTWNNGYLIEGDQSLKIAEKLEEEIDSGRTKAYEEGFEQTRKNLEKEHCELCDGTGFREDLKKKCNACNGEGKKAPFASNYPFGLDNVKEFAQFCKESGGFYIC